MAYIFQRGSVWWTEYVVNGRRVRESLGTHDKSKAKIAANVRAAEASKLRFAKRMGLDVPEDTREAKLPLREFLTRYKDHFLGAAGPAMRPSRVRTWRADHDALEKFVGFLEKQGLARVAQVARRHVEAFREWRATDTVMRRVPIPESELPKPRAGKPGPKRKRPKFRLEARPVSPATVNKGIRCGKAAWSWAVRMGFIRENPFKGVPLVKMPKFDPRNLSDFEIRKLLTAAADARLRPLVATALYTGLRLGELIALEWPEIDFKEGLVRVRCDETFQAKGRRSRVVPIAPELREILLPLRKAAGLCFTSETGEPLDDANVRKGIQRIAAAAGIVDFTPHDLRRTFASLLAARGVPTTRIRDYLGHESVATSEGYYLARGQVDARDVAGLAFGAPPVSPHSGENASETKTGVA